MYKMNRRNLMTNIDLCFFILCLEKWKTNNSTTWEGWKVEVYDGLQVKTNQHYFKTLNFHFKKVFIHYNIFFSDIRWPVIKPSAYVWLLLIQSFVAQCDDDIMIISYDVWCLSFLNIFLRQLSNLSIAFSIIIFILLLLLDVGLEIIILGLEVDCLKKRVNEISNPYFQSSWHLCMQLKWISQLATSRLTNVAIIQDIKFWYSFSINLAGLIIHWKYVVSTKIN